MPLSSIIASNEREKITLLPRGRQKCRTRWSTKNWFSVANKALSVLFTLFGDRLRKKASPEKQRNKCLSQLKTPISKTSKWKKDIHHSMQTLSLQLSIYVGQASMQQCRTSNQNAFTQHLVETTGNNENYEWIMISYSIKMCECIESAKTQKDNLQPWESDFSSSAILERKKRNLKKKNHFDLPSTDYTL